LTFLRYLNIDVSYTGNRIVATFYLYCIAVCHCINKPTWWWWRCDTGSSTVMCDCVGREKKRHNIL